MKQRSVNAGECGCNGSIRLNLAFMLMELLVTVFFLLCLLYREELLDEFLSACHRDGSPQKAVELVQLSTAFCLPTTPNLAKRALAEFDLTEEQRWGGEWWYDSRTCFFMWGNHWQICKLFPSHFVVWKRKILKLSDLFLLFFAIYSTSQQVSPVLSLDSESGFCRVANFWA